MAQKILTTAQFTGDPQITLKDDDTVGVKRHANGAIQIGLLGGDSLGEDAVCLQANRTSADQVAVGIGSIAIGKNAKAAATDSGYGDPITGCVAIGTGAVATASGYYEPSSGSCAIGNNSQATGEKSTAIGINATASGCFATATGYGATASGYNATAFGVNASTPGRFATALGVNASATGYYATAAGNGATASGRYATASGYYTTASGDGATASGYHSTASQAHSGAFGFRVKSAIANVQELGYWSNSSTRAGAVRVHGTRLVALTIQNRATAYGDGGATAGSEADNTLIREGYAIRRNGDVIFIDVNIGGTVKTLSLGTAA